jgi:hypothetical protein
MDDKQQQQQQSSHNRRHYEHEQQQRQQQQLNTDTGLRPHAPSYLPPFRRRRRQSQSDCGQRRTHLERWRSLANANLPQLLAQTTVVGRWRGRRRGLPELALPCIRTRHGLHQRPLLADTDTVTAGRSSALAVALAAWQLEENDCIGSEQMVAGEAPLKSSRQL